MHGFIILLPFVAAHAAEASAVEQDLQAADKLIDRAIMVRFVDQDQADFDHTALAKVGQIALPPPQAPQAQVRTIAVKRAQLPITIALPQTRGGYGVFGLSEIQEKESAAAAITAKDTKKGAPAPAKVQFVSSTLSVPATAPATPQTKTEPAPAEPPAPAKIGVAQSQPKLKSFVSSAEPPKPKAAPKMKAKPVPGEKKEPSESPKVSFALPSLPSLPTPSLPTLPTSPKGSEPVKTAAEKPPPAKVKTAAEKPPPAKAATGDEKPSSLGPLAAIGAAGAAFALRPFK